MADKRDSVQRPRLPLSRRQIACLRATAEGALYIKDGTAMRTVESLEARGLLELSVKHGRYGWNITPAGRDAIGAASDA